MIRFTSGDAAVETVSTDSFYNMRDQIHSDLERGGFGSRFPHFLNRFEPATWTADEIKPLLEEIETIAAAFKKLPPEPHLATSDMWDDVESGKSPTLYHVYRDAAGEPLLGSLIDLCRAALAAGRAIEME